MADLRSDLHEALSALDAETGTYVDRLLVI